MYTRHTLKFGDILMVSHDHHKWSQNIRRLIPSEDRKCCGYCGIEAKFNYGTWSNGLDAKPEFDNKTFCSMRCRKAFYNRKEKN